MIDVSSLEGQTLQLEEQPFALQAVLEGVRQQAEPALAGKAVQLGMELDAALPPVLVGDGHRLGQVLWQLVDNAIKFSESGQVTLRVTRVSSGTPLVGVRFAVVDQGMGMTDAQRARLFTLLEQGDGSSTRRQGGTGLGLALSQRLVTLMGGHIVVEAVQPQGSCFWFELKLPVGQAEPPAASEAGPVPSAAADADAAPPNATDPDPRALTQSAPVGGHPAPEAVEAAITRMAALLQDDDAEAQAHWHTHRAALSDWLQDDAAAFAQAIENFEFPEALAMLRARQGG